MPPDRRIIIDATFPWRIANELAARGYRDATSPHELGDASLKDPPLLRLINVDLEPAVLVTYDHKMPVQHRALLDKCGTTLAVVAKDRLPPHLTLEEYWREVIHRHAHRLADQAAGSQMLYRISGRRQIR